ncbi:MAG TPA: hypothetical protein VHK67_00875, partial [Rhabdochlamydiaceae bacterium]|nr:hypothetical protein [Rhabdochlamydiaceae bacterium]
MTTKGTNLTTNPVLTPGSIDRSSKTQPILGSERVDTIGRDVISDKSERAKVSTSYGISRIHYGIILPLKQRVVGLNAEQKANLTLYQTHVALSDQVDKVKSAYKAYRTAQKTADKAPLEPAIPRKGARQEAQAAGDKLVKSYDDLIKLALERVDAHQLDKNDYLNDIHSELGQGTKKYILQTVNQLRARMPVENQALVKGSRDHGHSVKHQYYDFVMDFVSHVCAAKNASGGDVNPQEVSTAFIRGLASIPELSEGLTLIHFYNQLNSKEFANGIEDRQLNAVIDHFVKQLKALIERPEDITSDELKSIHCHGIALSSVVPEVTAEDLNTLKATEKEHQEASLALNQAKIELEQNKNVIKDETSYSFKDVE